MEPVSSFAIPGCPRIEFGPGAFGSIPGLVAGFGRTALLVTGARSLKVSGHHSELLDAFRDRRIPCLELNVRGEPSPDLVDSACERFREKDIGVVLSVGGGSAIDAGKAISAMLPLGGGVEEYLEGVGESHHPGIKAPFIAVPTTSGTGSEATANAVLSRIGPEGYKASLRHPAFVPDVAVVDPLLTIGCPPRVTAAAGMDALTQLLGSYVSTKANPVTDALAPGAISLAGESLLRAAGDGSDDVSARFGMSYSALVSGITLASAGLGVVHGFASSVGALFEIPHGIVCGTLLAEATEANVEELERSGESGTDALSKYARAGSLLVGRDFDSGREAATTLVDTLHEWTETLRLPRLGEYGIESHDLERIVERTSQKNNPVTLSDDRMRRILESRL